MEENCPKCGLRRRSDWFRCPRCREILPDAPVAVTPHTEDPEPRSSRWSWASIAAAVVIGAGLVALMASDTTDVPAPSSARSQPAARQASPPAVAQAIDQEQAAASSSANARMSGDDAYAQGDLDAARAEYEAAVAANPDDAESRNNLAQVLMRLNLPAMALVHLDEAVRINSQKWAYRFNRARAYGETNRLKEAVDEYVAAAALFPSDYATQYNLGLTRMKLKQYPAAVSALEQAVKLAPGEASFLITLGTAYVAVEKPDQAKATFEQFLELAPDDPEVPRVKALLSALDAARQD